MEGIGACTALQELYLSHNGIPELEVCSSGKFHSYQFVQAQVSDYNNRQWCLYQCCPDCCSVAVCAHMLRAHDGYCSDVNMMTPVAGGVSTS